MRSILIDAQKGEIREIELDQSKSLKDTYAAIGNGCNLVETGIYLNDTETIMVDEEGYFKDNLRGFVIADDNSPERFFYGNGVVWNTDEDGEVVSTDMSIDEMQKLVKWVNLEDSQRIRQGILNRGPQLFF